MKKVLFLGAKEIGEFCLRILIEDDQTHLVGVGGSRRRNFSDEIMGLLEEKETPLLKETDDILQYNFDILISVQYDRILRRRHLDQANELNVNLHMAPLPEYRGCNQFTFALLDGKKEFGTSLHIMTEEADAGDLLFERRFSMEQIEWVKELQERTVKESKGLFEEHWPAIRDLKISPKAQSDYFNERSCSTHFRKEIEEVKQIQADWPLDKQKLHFRASYFPPFEPPLLINGNERKKVDLSWYENLG